MAGRILLVLGCYLAMAIVFRLRADKLHLDVLLVADCFVLQEVMAATANRLGKPNIDNDTPKRVIAREKAGRGRFARAYLYFHRRGTC